MQRFIGKTALVSGGAQGIGEAVVRALVAEGAKVAIADLQVEAGEALARELGPNARFVALDVCDEAQWADAVAQTEQAFGPIGVLVNNAGIFVWKSIEKADAAHWRRTLDVNVVGTFLGIRAVLPSMRAAGGGAIVNFSSLAGLQAAPGAAAYSASKWAVRGLTRTAAVELGKDNIRVNSVHPGLVRTPMSSQAGFTEAVTQHQPIPRISAPEEIAGMVLFAASDQASFSTGSEFVADGGAYAGTTRRG
ncbi:MAG: glucose 1-dehydrogenase [Burkholderiales bacterium]